MAKKNDNTETAVAVPASMFTICNELQAIREKLEAAEGELQDGDFDELKKWEAAIEVKAENIAHMLIKLDSQAQYFAEIEKLAYKRRSAFQAAHARLKTYLRDAMAFAGVKSIKKDGGLFSISLQDGKQSVKVTDPGKLPFGTFQIVEEIKPDLKLIKAMLDDGKAVAGAHIETGQPFLRIS